MAGKQNGWAENVQLTLPWQRFAQLTTDGALSKEELSELNKQGRIALVDDFQNKQVSKKEEIDTGIRSGPKTQAGSEQKNRKRPRETVDKKSVRSRQDQSRKMDSKTSRAQGKNWLAEDSGCNSSLSRQPNGAKEKMDQYPIGSARKAESWLSYN